MQAGHIMQTISSSLAGFPGMINSHWLIVSMQLMPYNLTHLGDLLSVDWGAQLAL